MKLSRCLILLALVASGLAPARAAVKPAYGLAADNRIFAQTLVNELMAQNPDLVTAGIHCVPPGGGAQTIVASTLDVIGKKSDPEDIDVGARGQSLLAPNLKVGKFGVMLPLHDRGGREIGALALAFKYRDGDDQARLYAEATAIRNRLAPEIPALGSLFAVAPSAGAASDLSALPAYAPAAKVSGVIRNYGNAYAGVLKKWEEGFRQFQPGVSFSDTLPTSDAAFPGLITGLADLAPDGGEPALTETLAFYEVYGHHATSVTVGSGTFDVEGRSPGMVVFVHRDNPLTRLTLAQLDGIFGAERNGGLQGFEWTLGDARGPEKNIRTWGQLGLTGEWADKPIQTYGHAPSGASRFFELRVLHSSGKWNPNYRGYVETGSKMISEADRAAQHGGIRHMLEQELAQDRYGIAWTIMPQAKGIAGIKPVALAVDERGPYVAPSRESFRQRTYPLVRNIYIYLNRRPGAPVEPKLREFLRYILSREGQQVLADDGGFLPLPAAAVEQERAKLD